MRISDWSSDVCSSDLAIMLRALAESAPPIKYKRFFISQGQGGWTMRQTEAPSALADANHRHRNRTMRRKKFSAGAIVTAASDSAQPNVTIAKIRSAEHTSELQSLMRISYAVFCLKKT